MSVQGIFQRKEAPYDTDCFLSWSQTNYSEPFLGTKIWPYSFMVSSFAQDNILAPTGSLEVIINTLQNSFSELSSSLLQASTSLSALLQLSLSALFQLAHTSVILSDLLQSFIFFFKHFVQQCKRFCVLNAVMQDCGCFHPLYLDIDDTRDGKPPCDLGNSTADLCIKGVMAQFSGALRACPCNQVSILRNKCYLYIILLLKACYQTQYTAAVSSAMWPAKQYEASVRLKVDSDKP